MKHTDRQFRRQHKYLAFEKWFSPLSPSPLKKEKDSKTENASYQNIAFCPGISNLIDIHISYWIWGETIFFSCLCQYNIQKWETFNYENSIHAPSYGVYYNLDLHQFLPLKKLNLLVNIFELWTFSSFSLYLFYRSNNQECLVPLIPKKKKNYKYAGWR